MHQLKSAFIHFYLILMALTRIVYLTLHSKNLMNSINYFASLLSPQYGPPSKYFPQPASKTMVLMVTTQVSHFISRAEPHPMFSWHLMLQKSDKFFMIFWFYLISSSHYYLRLMTIYSCCFI